MYGENCSFINIVNSNVQSLTVCLPIIMFTYIIIITQSYNLVIYLSDNTSYRLQVAFRPERFVVVDKHIL